MSYFLTDDAVKLYYEVHGEGEKTMILVHGGSANSKFYKKQVPVLSKHYKVVTYDLRGHGASEIPDYGFNIKRMGQDLRDLIEYLKLENIYIVGWSLGTAIMLSYVEQFGQDKIGGLIVVDMTTKSLTDETCQMGLYGKYTLEDCFQTVMDINNGWANLVPGFGQAFFGDLEKCKDEIEWAIAEEMKNSEAVMVRIWVQFATIDQRHILPQITVPTLITYGGTEKLYKRGSSEYIHNAIPGSKLICFEGASHALFLECPDEFNNAVIEFVGKGGTL